MRPLQAAREAFAHIEIDLERWERKSTLDDLDWRKPVSPSDLVVSLSHNRMCVRPPFGGIGGTFRQIAAVKCLPALRKLRYPEVYHTRHPELMDPEFAFSFEYKTSRSG